MRASSIHKNLDWSFARVACNPHCAVLGNSSSSHRMERDMGQWFLFCLTNVSFMWFVVYRWAHFIIVNKFDPIQLPFGTFVAKFIFVIAPVAQALGPFFIHLRCAQDARRPFLNSLRWFSWVSQQWNRL